MGETIKFRVEVESNGEKVFKTLNVNVEDFNNLIEGARAGVEKLSNPFSKLASEMVVLDSLNSAIGELQGLLGGLAEDFNAFDKGMRMVNTMAGESKEGLADLTGQVEDLAKVIPLAKDELAKGLYQVISNGVPKDNWISFLERSARSSVGGVADLGQTVTVTSTIIKNYGLEWEAAGEIQDKIQMTAKNGVTSFEQLGQALPRVTGNAATLGVSIDELMATFATLTGVSGNTAEVSTQLAAVFTALVKPSSEAAEMASAMGLQFDAASIKAAGGMQNFLQKVTTMVESYASAHGMLEQEIYGRLFGSAEALRALIPLTGELSDTFTTNISAMAGSAGTIDQAFEQMAGSGEASMQMFENSMSTMFSWVGSVASAAQPTITFVAVTTQTATGVIKLWEAGQKGIAALTALAAAHRGGAVAGALNAMHTKVVAVAQRLLAASSVTATAGTWALNAAVAALYATMTLGVSLVITAIVGAITSLGEEAEDAAGGVDDLQEATDAFTNAATDAKAEIDLEVATLKDLIDQNGDATDAVEKLNNKYGEAFGYHKTAAEWYDVLVRKSKAYCNQIGYEAQAKVLASKIAAKTLELEDTNEEYQRLKSQTFVGDGVKWGYEMPGGGGYSHFLEVESSFARLRRELGELQNKYDQCINRMIQAGNELKTSSQGVSVAVGWEAMSYEELGKAIEKQKKIVAGLAGVKGKEAEAKAEAAKLRKMSDEYDRLGRKYGLSNSGNSKNSGNKKNKNNKNKNNKNKNDKKDEYSGEKLIDSPTSVAEIENNIKYYNDAKRKTKDDGKYAEFTANIVELEKQKEQLELKALKGTLPTEINSIQDADKWLDYYNRLLKVSGDSEKSGIEGEIKKIEKQKKGLEQLAEDAKWTGFEAEGVKSYAEIEEALTYYEGLVKRSEGTAREEAQKTINVLRRKQKELDEALAALNAPGDISTLGSLGELEAAIGYYSERLQTATKAELGGIEKTIIALEKKRKALERIVELPRMEGEIGELRGLTGKKLRVELELIGLEGIRGKIRDLEKMLGDVENPLGDDERKRVEELVKEWKGYELQLQKSQLTLKGAWDGVKGIGEGITGLTETLEGNGSVWEKIVGVIDGALGLYESIEGVIGIVKLLTQTTEAQAVAEGVKATAVATGAATEATATATELGTSAATTAAVGIEAGAWSALAAAKTFAAHASIPFAGTPIAAGFVATQQGLIASAAIPKFAEGGIAYGPTLGIFGEYAGARSNPEVVAPLDRLRSLVGGDGEPTGGGKVVFKIDGRTLVGVLEKTERFNKRTK